jgi:tetratricopeptide (TPR) repeat protein
MTPDTTFMAEAIQSLETALSISGSARDFAPLAEAYRLAGRLDEALRTAERGVASFPSHVGIRVVMARTLTDLNDFDGAHEAYARVLQLDPGNLEAMSFIGPLTENESAAADSGAEQETAGPAEPEDAAGSLLSEELAHLDELFVSPFQLDEPYDEESKSLSIATLTLAEIYSRQGLMEEAARVCEAILARQPDNEEARRALDVYQSQPSSV